MVAFILLFTSTVYSPYNHFEYWTQLLEYWMHKWNYIYYPNTKYVLCDSFVQFLSKSYTLGKSLAVPALDVRFTLCIQP